MPLRILHVVHQYSPHHVGGTELYTQTVARRQVTMGQDTAVFCPAPVSAPELYHLQTEKGVRVYRVPVGERGRGAVFLSNFWQKKLKEAFTAVLTREKPDLIHIQHLMGLPIALLNQPLPAPYAITLHDYWYVCANGQLITNTDEQTCAGPAPNFINCGQCALARAGLPHAKPPAALVAPLMRYRNRRLLDVLARAEAVIAPTEFVRDTYRAQGAPTHNLRVVRHGIDVPLDALEKLRAARPYQPTRPLHLGFVGSIARQKGVHLLIEAVNGLPDNAVKLTLFGGLDTFADYVDSLRQMATHPHINFAGRVERDQLWAELAQLDALVMPTLWYEASPLTIDEAFAIGLPIVAAEIGAMGEKIRDGVDGRLFTVGSAPALREVLVDLMANPEQLLEYHRAIPTVRTTAVHLAELETVYRKMIN